MKNYRIIETEHPPQLTEVSEKDGFVINRQFTTDFRIRTVIYDMLKQARTFLPTDLTIVVYEAYRAMDRQKKLWHDLYERYVREHPDWDQGQLVSACEVFVANPYKDGSGHQTGAAVDVTLATLQGQELDMGTAMQAFTPLTKTIVDGLSDEQINHRRILVTAMERAGFINYPEEWWHYSYGERLWAELTGARETRFAMLPL